MSLLRQHLTPLNIVLVLLLVATTIVGFVLVAPGSSLPVHWGLDGQPDSVLPRDQALLLLPGLAVVVALLLVFARRLGNPEASRHAVGVAVTGALGLFLVLDVATVMIGAGGHVDMIRLVVLALGVLSIVLGNILPKTQPNPIAGVRLPWTMHDPLNWQATNRLGGLLMLLGGIAMVAVALLTDAPALLLPVTLAALVVPILVATIYSWRLSRRP